MKEQIYTIPINEAMEENGECPFCILEKKLEDEALSYALGAAMMEPDYRIESNKKGYCNKHFGRLFSQKNKLSLALVLETLTKENIDELLKFKSQMENVGKKNLFKKDNSTYKELLDNLKEREESCIVCDRINSTMERYLGVFLDMYEDSEEFREKVKNSKGVCFVHLRQLIEKAQKEMKPKFKDEFIKLLYEKQITETTRVLDDLKKFILKFDYRYQDMELGEAVDSPKRCIEKTMGYINTPDME